MKNLIIASLVSCLFAGTLVSRIDAQTQQETRKRTPAIASTSLPDGISTKDVTFYSEGIQCHGRIFLPRGFGADSKIPAVVVAPGWGKIESSVESFANRFAVAGLVAMTIDYRGWGQSGGFLQTVDEVKTDDRLRFSQMTTRVRIRRKRLIPQHQILDIRNALYYLQGEPGVDRARVGVWGTGMAGGHVIVIAATDARVKAVVADSPIIDGKDTPRKASSLTGAMLKADQRRARSNREVDQAGGLNDVETRLALSSYHPFWYVDQVPKTTAVLFVTSVTDVKGTENTQAAAKRLAGPTDVVQLPAGMGLSSGKSIDAASKAAADWFLKHL